MNPRTLGNTACAARWKVTPVASELEQDMPGVGFFRWDVQLLKVRNGESGQWQIQWTAGRFDHLIIKVQKAVDKDLRKNGMICKGAMFPSRFVIFSPTGG